MARAVASGKEVSEDLRGGEGVPELLLLLMRAAGAGHELIGRRARETLVLVVHLDATRLLLDVLGLAELRGGDPNIFLRAAEFMAEHDVKALDALHAAYCGNDTIISSDTVFDQLGLERIPLAA